MTIETEQQAQAWLRETLGADEAAMARLALLVDMLLAENERENLVAHGTLPRAWQRHILDSAQLLRVSRETLPNGLWLDLGTGAGFPGLVIAALQPSRPVTLVDSRKLRTDWLQRACGAMELANVAVRHARVEDLPDFLASVISARAFAPLDRLLTLSARFSTPDTIWLLPKGASAQHEVQMLPKTCQHMFHVEQSLTNEAAGVVSGKLLTLDASAPLGRNSRKGKRR